MNVPPKIILEIVCANLESAIVAQSAGADRIELCENLSVGGLTPDHELISRVRQLVSLKLHVMIRPRSGDFLYSPEEFETMKNDIRFCKKMKANGVVFGLLLKNNQIDVKRSAELVALAKPMPVTFHRAFDISVDPVSSMEDVIRAGYDRILSSGQADSALKGSDLLQELIQRAGKRIVVMPGAGINPENVCTLLARTHASEIHASCLMKNKGTSIQLKDLFGEHSVHSEDENLSAVPDVNTIRLLRSNAETCLAEISK